MNTTSVAPRWRGLSLRWKLIVPLLVLSVLVIAIIVNYELARALHDFSQQHARAIDGAASMLAHQCAVAVALGDDAWTARLVASALQGSDVVYCAVLDERGVPIASERAGSGDREAARRDLCLRLPGTVPRGEPVVIDRHSDDGADPLAVASVAAPAPRQPRDVADPTSAVVLLGVHQYSTSLGEPILEVTKPLMFRRQSGSTEDFLVLDSSPSSSEPLVRVGYLRLASSLASGQERLRVLNRQTITAVVLLTLLIVVMIYVVVTWGLRPLNQVAAAAALVAAGDLDERVEASSHDEVGGLVAAFNRMVEHLRDSRGFNEVVGSSMPLGLCLFDEAGIIVRANELTGRMLDTPTAELTGRSIGDVLPEPSSGNPVTAPLPPSEPARSSFVLPGARPDGTDRYLDGLVVPLPHRGAGLERATRMLLLQDVSIVEHQRQQQRRFEESLVQSGRLASLGQMSAGGAHECNNILQIISTYTELALLEAQDDGMRCHLERVFTGTERASAIVSGLLAFARRLNLQMAPHDLRRLVIDTLVLVTFGFGRKNIQVVNDVEDLPPVSIDAGQIQQVLINLFKNAGHAMTHGGGTLTIRGQYHAGATVTPSLRSGLAADELAAQATDPSSDDGLVRSAAGRGAFIGVVELAVSDTGRGIAPEDLPRIFDPFFSTKGVYARNDEERQMPGTGLGLALSYGIISNHHGEISVTSTLGKGTTFTLRLPHYAADVAAGAAAERSSSIILVPSVRQLPDESPLVGRSLLVVDDEIEISSQIATYFAGRGLHVVQANCGADALLLLRGRPSPFDVVVSDILMPGLSGFELLQRIRESELAHHVILLTGKYTDEISFIAHESGADVCIAKPIRLAELHDTICMTLGLADRAADERSLAAP